MRTITKKVLSNILIAESRMVLFRYRPRIIAITGSVGKTGTKDAVFAVLSGVSYVRKSEKSYNSEIGLPLTILGCPNGWNNPLVWIKNILRGLWLFLYPHKYPKWLVLEVGVGKPGDMKKTASWLKTDAVIVTAIGEVPVHIEFFDSRKHLIEEKSQLIKTLKRDGLLVLNADDEAALSMKNKTKNRVITFGFEAGADILGSGQNISYDEAGRPEGIIFRVDEGGNSLPVAMEKVFGRNYVYASLAALALASGLKYNMVNAIGALKSYEVSPGRMSLLSGIENSLIIDDTYNSSPYACEAALKTLGEIKGLGRKIAILGDMLELGRHTQESHVNMGKIAKENCDILAAVGPRAADIKEGAIEAGMKAENVLLFPNSTEAGESMQGMIKENDLILIKGSQGMRMEKTAYILMKDKAESEKLLVRQEAEWRKR